MQIIKFFTIQILVRSFQTLLIISNGISLLHIRVQQNITIHDISVVNYLLRWNNINSLRSKRYLLYDEDKPNNSFWINDNTADLHPITSHPPDIFVIVGSRLNSISYCILKAGILKTGCIFWWLTKCSLKSAIGIGRFRCSQIHWAG